MIRWTPLGYRPALIRAWPDGVIIYNTLSGETHILNPLAHEMLSLIADRPRSEEEIVEALQEAVGGDPAEIVAAVRNLLAELNRLGLAEPHGS